MSPSAPSRYQEIAAELRRRIQDGELAPGTRIPSTRAIVDEWDVAMATATKVLTELRHEGLVRPVRGVGTVVAGARPAGRPTSAPRRSAGPEGGLTLDRIVTAGIRIADAEGLGALSMRRVASEVGVATMSLYRHVADKDELLLRMMDVVFQSWQLPSEPPAAWRQRLESVARLIWDGCRQHPWLASAMSITRPQPLPGAVAISEFGLATLDGLGLDYDTTFTAYITFVNYVRGTALNLELEAEAEAVTGVDSEEWTNAQASTMRALAETGQFPVFTRYVSREYDFDLDKLFEFGLRRLLDGIAVLLDAAHGQT
jgi:AcrR family transcriptional regulator